LEALAVLDWKNGDSIRIEYRWASGDVHLLQTLAAEFAGLSLDVALTQGAPPTAALRQATATTPIVFVSVAGPVGSGPVANLAHPCRNVTGFANYETGMGEKWLATLREVAPSVNRVAVLVNPENAGNARLVQAMEAAASKLRVQLSTAPVRDRAEIERAFET